MAQKKFRLKVVTPERLSVDKDVSMVILQTIDGQMGVLAGHEPVVTVLDHGVLRYYDDEKIEKVAVFGGYAEVNQREVVVLAETAERPEDIDVIRAKQANERANRYLNEQRAEMDVMRAKVALRKSLVRLELSGQPLTPDKK